MRRHAGRSTSCAAGSTEAGNLAAISRELAYNDPQRPPAAGTGSLSDRNVELIIAAPPAP
jgi:hypothetical protein